MIEFNYETDFSLANEPRYRAWLEHAIALYGSETGELNYYFYDDEALLEINKEHLNHDTYTDIISFDYTVGAVVSGDICISVDRVKENAVVFAVSEEDEMARVMAHGVLHFLGYKDKTDSEKTSMRNNEDILIKILKYK